LGSLVCWNFYIYPSSICVQLACESVNHEFGL
jgi:hypothetical protein